MTDAILALNAGSSSVKFALFELGGNGLSATVRGEVEGLGAAPHAVATNADGASVLDRRWSEDPGHDALVGWLLDWVKAHLGADTLAAVGHRVVHGGQDFTAPVRLTPDIVDALDRLTPLAPLHQPHSLAPVRAITALQPDLPQVACFDTAFHHTMPPVATAYALPRSYADAGVRRYGFHGLSYEFIARRLRETAPALADGRVVVAHLGNGASLCAMQNGRSMDTTMGFTALDGLVMGTRCGALDPGVVLYMLQEQGLDAASIEHVLYKESGLLGVSGLSSDVRTLEVSDDPHSREAIDLFAYRVGRETAALASSMGGLDGFVFTAGIGEHSAAVRAAVTKRLAWFGALDIRMIPTDEEATIASHTREVLGLDK